MNDFSFFVRPVESRSGKLRPVIELLFRNYQSIYWNPERTKQPAKADHLVAFVNKFSFNYEKIDIGILARVSPRVRPKKNHPCWIRCVNQNTYCLHYGV